LATRATTISSLVVKHRFDQASDRRLYKLFSHAKLNDTLLDHLIAGRTSTFRKQWSAYPKLRPIRPHGDGADDGASDSYRGFPDIVLHSGVFYVNAMEYAFSTMETEVIAARNVALLLAEAVVKAQ
jgi:prenylcysteine oxidase / farnesylcysteine lyase